MNFAKHSNLEGQHAFLSASGYHWINYSEEKIADAYAKYRAAQRGTALHAFAAQCIKLGQRLPKSQKTLNMYVNDAIGYKMTPEQILYYSPNCFGTADAISFRKDILRIHDLKTGVRLLSKAATQIEMGKISNLITDMTLKGAPEEEITKAVKHSMVVIDAAKHKLDYKRSEIENDIPTLRKRWQGYIDPETGKEVGGASTLLSRRKQNVSVPERQGSGRIDRETGKVIYKESGRTYVDPKTGKTVPATTQIKLLEKTDDIRTLSSGTVQEDAYADYANRMKALANRARLEYLATPTLVRNASAAKAYAPEVTRLTSALKTAQLNAPREREAQRIANAQVKAKIQANNVTDKDEISKIRRAAISDARVATGASGKGTRITISDGEWEAIQAGAISDTTLKEILRYADPDVVRARATPRASTQLSEARINRIKAMANSGCTNAEIADALNLSSSVVSKYLNE